MTSNNGNGRKAWNTIFGVLVAVVLGWLLTLSLAIGGNKSETAANTAHVESLVDDVREIKRDVKVMLRALPPEGDVNVIWHARHREGGE
jgi:hypothetical protein